MLQASTGRTARTSSTAAPDIGRRPLPTCPHHAGSLVRTFRTRGCSGPGVYPQCVPGNGELPHLLAWGDTPRGAKASAYLPRLSRSEVEVLEDAAQGLSTVQTARKRSKGAETVKTQRRSILLKLGAQNMAHAIAMITADGTGVGALAGERS
jgi:DNA-binding CsgD family transcriptional regulator